MLLCIAVRLQHLPRRAMAAIKSTTLTLRINPGVKETLRTAAEQEHRSITNMVKVLIRDYCSNMGIKITWRQTAKK